MHVCCALFVLAELLSIAQGPGAPKTLALKVLHEGDPAPGIPGATIYYVLAPQIDAAGNVLAAVYLAGAGIDPSNDNVLYYGPPGKLQIVAREGDPAPNLPGLKLGTSSPSVVQVSEDGWISYRATLAGPGVIKDYNDRAAFVGPPGDIRLLARTGDPAPGLEFEGTILAEVTGFGPRISDNHTVLLFTDLAGPLVDPTNDRAYYIGPRDDLRLVWRRGMPAPGTEPGVTFAWADLVVFNDARQIAFRGGLTGPGIGDDNHVGLWLGGPGALTLIARDGDPVPGFSEGVTYVFAIAGLPTINPVADTSAAGRLQGPGITTDNDDIFYVAGLWPFDILVRAGDPAPEAGPGVEIDAVGSSLINARREVSYRIKYRAEGIDDSNRWAVYFGPYEDAQLTLRDGNPAPYLPNGVFLKRVVAVPALSAMNDSGDIVAPTQIDGPGVTEANKVVLWLRAATLDEWLPLLRSGVALGGRVVAAATEDDFGQGYQNKTGGSDGYAQSLADTGLLCCRLKFTDGTRGLFVLRLVYPGDMNCDGVVNAFDIDPFVLALTDAGDYAAKYPGCAIENADLNGDGKIDAFDIDPFVEALTAP